METVFLYAGQGSQHVGMGKDFYETYESYRSFVDGISSELPLKELMHEGPLEELSKTEHTQACMAVFAAGVTRLLTEHGIKPDAAGGLSLGEYGALFSAGVFDAKAYVDLVTYRGRVMMEAARGLNCSMSAVLGLDGETIDSCCKAYEGNDFVAATNFNCPGQTVICGDEPAVSAVEEQLKEKGAKRCVRLNVSGPFHTKYMKPAGDALNQYFADMEFHKPMIPVVTNVTGSWIGETDDIKQLLVSQVQNSVHLEEDLRTLIEAGYDNFIEIGPGNAMAGFLKKTAKAMGAAIQVKSIDTVEDFRKVIDNE